MLQVFTCSYKHGERKMLKISDSLQGLAKLWLWWISGPRNTILGLCSESKLWSERTKIWNEFEQREMCALRRCWDERRTSDKAGQVEKLLSHFDMCICLNFQYTFVKVLKCICLNFEINLSKSWKCVHSRNAEMKDSPRNRQGVQLAENFHFDLKHFSQFLHSWHH